MTAYVKDLGFTAGGDLSGSVTSQKVVSLSGGATGIVTVKDPTVIAMGPSPASSGSIRMSNLAFINFKTTTAIDTVGVAVNVSNQLLLGDGNNAGFVLTGGGASAFRSPSFGIQPTAGTINSLLFTGLAAGSNLAIAADATMLSTTITQNQQANTSAPANIVIAPQAPGASATNIANGTPGSLNVNFASPVSGGAEGYLTIARGGVAVVSMGAYPGFNQGNIYLGLNGVAPSATNWVMNSDGNSANLNSPGGSGFNMRMGGTLYYNWTTAGLNTQAGNFTITCGNGIAGNTTTLKGVDVTAPSSTGGVTTIQAQNATGTTSVGGALVLQSGTGTTTPGSIFLSAGAVNAAVVSASGSNFWGGLTGSLQKTSAGLSYLVAQGALSIISQSNGQLILSTSGGSGGWLAGGDLSGTLSSQQVAGLSGGANGLVIAPEGVSITMGSKPSTSGSIRLSSGFSITAMNSIALTTTMMSFNITNNNVLTIGDPANVSTLWLTSGAPIVAVYGSGQQFYFKSGLTFAAAFEGQNFELGGSAGSYGGGVGVMSLLNAATKPSTNPSSGSILFSSGSNGGFNVRHGGGLALTLGGGGEDFIGMGSGSAQTGYIRFPKNGAGGNETYIMQRNSTNTADLNILTYQFGDLWVGNTTTNTRLVGAAAIDLRTSAGNSMGLSLTNIYCSSVTGIFNTPAGGSTDFSIKNTDIVTASVTGSSLTLQAQNATGATTIGGDLILQSGTGTSASGSVSIRAGVQEVVGYKSLQGTINTQALINKKYLGVGRTTTNSAVAVLTIPVPSNNNVTILALITARDVTSGVVGNGYAEHTLWQYKNISGTVTGADTNVIGFGAVGDTAMMAGCSTSATVSGTNVLIKVTGLTSTTIDWIVSAEVITT